MLKRILLLTMAVLLALSFSVPPTAMAENREAQKLFERARFENEDGKHQDALGFVEKALSLDPTNLSYQNLKGVILVRLKRYKEGAAILEKVVAADPEGQKSAFIELGGLYATLKDYKKAAAIWKRLGEG